jgi:hypothetical protein
VGEAAGARYRKTFPGRLILDQTLSLYNYCTRPDTGAGQFVQVNYMLRQWFDEGRPDSDWSLLMSGSWLASPSAQEVLNTVNTLPERIVDVRDNGAPELYRAIPGEEMGVEISMNIIESSKKRSSQSENR